MSKFKVGDVVKWDRNGYYGVVRITEIHDELTDKLFKGDIIVDCWDYDTEYFAQLDLWELAPEYNTPLWKVMHGNKE